MPKRIFLKLCLLSGVIFTGIPTQADYNALPGLNNLAKASTRMTRALERQGQPLQMDLAAFPRNGVGALTAVMYAKGEQPAFNQFS